MEARRLRAPTADGEILAIPGLGEVGALLAGNRTRLQSWNHDFQGRIASTLRQLARREALDASQSLHAQLMLDSPTRTSDPINRPWVVTGHQPELSHPGVWVKNFAAGRIAAAQAGLGFNLIVDNDFPKRSFIRVPTRHTTEGVRVISVPYDAGGGEIPFEDGVVQDPHLFATFGTRVRDTLGGLVSAPLIDDFWSRVTEVSPVTPRIGLRFSAARRSIEADWGIHNSELTLSDLSRGEAFAWFACHLLAHLDRFRAIHNQALGRYRELNGIRSRHHPVPSLDRDAEGWQEAPFWVWRAGQNRRRPLLAKQGRTVVELRIAEEPDTLAELPLAPDRDACCAVERLRELQAQGIRIRTRALTTTMFARLLLGDLFIHGIGGAKYDELGDEIVRAFFGFEPPAFQTLTLTLMLGIVGDAQADLSLEQVERQIRDLEFNPIRYLPTPHSPEVQAWIDERWSVIRSTPPNRRGRVARFHEIRRLNSLLSTPLIPLRDQLLRERDRLRTKRERYRLLRSREYAAVLHDPARLKAAFRLEL